MTILLLALSVAFAAFCVWLGVRIVNRRERWAKRTLAAIIGLPVLYVASFGPACWWLSADDGLPGPVFMDVSVVYLPIGRIYLDSEHDSRTARVIAWYATLRYERVTVPFSLDDQRVTISRR